MEKGKGEGEGKGKRKVKKKTKRKRKNGEGKGKKEKEEKRKRKKDNNRQWERKEERREEREGKRREKNELIKLEWARESQQSSPSTRGTSCTRACLTTRKCVGHVLREEGSDWSRMWSPWKASIVLHPEGSPLPSAEQHPGTQVSASLGTKKIRNVKEGRAWGHMDRKKQLWRICLLPFIHISYTNSWENEGSLNTGKGVRWQLTCKGEEFACF